MKKNKEKHRILIVDDHPIVRRGLAALIEEESDLEVCGEAADTVEAIKKINELNPDLALVDMSLETGHGLLLIKQLRDRNNDLLVLVASIHDEHLFAERALRAGAQGYIQKQADTEKIIAAIRHVLDGNIYLSTEMTNRLLQRDATPNENPAARLSNRELSVFEMIGQGLTTREIAERLHLSIKTIETYREHIKDKLNLANGSELTRQAVQWVLENSN